MIRKTAKEILAEIRPVGLNLRQGLGDDASRRHRRELMCRTGFSLNDLGRKLLEHLACAVDAAVTAVVLDDHSALVACRQPAGLILEDVGGKLDVGSHAIVHLEDDLEVVVDFLVKDVLACLCLLDAHLFVQMVGNGLLYLFCQIQRKSRGYKSKKKTSCA